eukprot:s341_g3.t4
MRGNFDAQKHKKLGFGTGLTASLAAAAALRDERWKEQSQLTRDTQRSCLFRVGHVSGPLGVDRWRNASGVAGDKPPSPANDEASGVRTDPRRAPQKKNDPKVWRQNGAENEALISYPLHTMADLDAMKGMAAESVQHAVARQQMQAAFNGVNSIAKDLKKDFGSFLSCGDSWCMTIEDTEPGGQEEISSHWLRLCVHHGIKMPHEPTYVEVICNKGLRREQRFASKAVTAATSPTWDFTIEVPLIKEELPSIHIRIMKSHLIPSEQGIAQLSLESQGKGVQVEELDLHLTDLTHCCASPGACVVVAWQLGHALDFKGDLSRAGSMDKTAMRKQTFHLEVTVKSLRLLHDLDGSEKIWLKLFLVDRAGAEYVIVHTVGAVDQEDSKGMLFANGFGRFEFHETEVSLADYDLVMQLWDRSSKTRAQMMGEWKDPISELRDLIKGRGLQLHFRALMHQGLRNVGEVTMMLDILDSQTTVPHEEPKRSKLPKRRGKTEMERKDKFYLHIGSLGVEASRTRRPYVKVISAEGTVSSSCEYEEVENATGKFGEFTDALQVKVTAQHAMLRIQLFQDKTESELLGQAIIYEAYAEHGPCWRQIYGPRSGGLSMLGLGVLDSQKEEAEEMARGRLPPSCYHGSLYITCDRFAGRIVGLVSQMTRSLLPSRFRVRLHRGVYLDRYCNQKILVRVQIPGSAQLLFPAEVNAQGVVRFGGDVEAAPAPSPLEEEEENNAWVERWIDGLLLEDVSQAFVYIHREYDGLSRPPEIFGTIQLHFAQSSPAVPQWSMLQYDRSVLSAPKLPGTAAQGFLLGSVTVDTAPAGAAKTTEPTVTTAKARTRLPVYAHVDVLAARNLPASDADGLADPCYEVRIEEMTLKLEEPARRTLNPSFLHRLVLGPLLLPVDEGQGQLMSKDTMMLPPILISVKDKDGSSEQSSFTLLGKAALCNLPSLDYHDEHRSGLDVNRSHQAVWYSLDGDAEVNFESHLNSSWVLRPRMLIAAGYSTCPDVPKAQVGVPILEDLGEGQIKRISQIGTEKWMKYNISVDLLGLREVSDPEDVFDQFNDLQKRLFGELTKTPGSEKTLEICLTPFWHGAEQSFIPVRLDGKNCKGQKDPARSEGFWRSLHPIVSCEKTAPQIPGLPASPSKKSTDWYNLVVLKNPDDRSCGWRLSVSNYVAPIIPYLQTPFNHKVPVESVETPSNFKPSKLSSWVLLPDLVFRIRSHKTDLGSVCVTLPISSHHLPSDLSQQVSKALRTVRILDSAGMHESHEKHKSWASNIVSIASGKHSDSSGHSRQKGGKFLPRENDLVEVLKRDGATGWTYGRLVEETPAPAEPMEGWFPDWWIPPEDADWMQECLNEFQELDPGLQGLPQLPLSEQKEDPYDIYVDVFAEISGKLKWNDNFHVDKQLLTPHLFTIEHEDKLVLHFFNPSDWMAGHAHHAEESFDHRTMPRLWAEPDAATPSGRHEVPYGPAHLWRRVLWGRAGPLRHQRTKELKALAKKKDFRLVSHQHRPEPPGGGHLSENLHTFVRALGHRIEPEQDRDSKLLARLRVCPARSSYKRKGPIHLYDKGQARWTFIMEPTNLLSASQNGKFVLMVHPEAVELHPQPDQAIRIHLGPSVKVEIPSEERNLVEKFLEMLKPGEPQEHQACSILVVRFHLAGEVVWAPPNHLLNWHEPGQVLFVVKLAETDDLVTVPVPSFDVRYPLETIWYPSKTLAGGRDFRPASAAVSPETVVPVDGAATVPKHKVKHVPEDGYSHGIHVSKHAFCCRIMKQGHTRNFDRVGTKNWFRAVLSEVSPDVAALPILEHLDNDFVKEVVLSKWANVRRRLMGPDDKEVGTMKAHVQVEAVEETDGTSAEQIEVVQNALPVERLWLHDSFALNVYLLTVRGIQSPDFRAPYIRAFIMGSEEEPQQLSARLTHDDGSGCDFYRRMTFDLMLPGDGVLVLQLWAKPLLQLTDQLLGEAHVDLEDRQMALMYKRLRSASSNTWIQSHLSPAEPLEVTTERIHHQHHWGRTWCDPTKVHQKRLEVGGSARKATLFHPHSRKAPSAYRPHLAPPSPAPIEALALYRDGKVLKSGKTGTLRTWMDLFTFQERVPEVDFSSLKEIPMPLQVRIKIFQVDGISVFKDFGERNDVYVRGILTCQPVGKQASVALLQTDVHKYAHKTASFNYSWTFDIEAPVRECHITLDLLDQDTVTGADQIYAPKVLSLEPLVAATYFARTWKKAEPQEVQHQVVFDCFPPDHPLRPRRFCFCCCKRGGKRPHVHPEPATLSMAIEVVFRESMALPPRIESFAEPKDRVDVRELILRPQKAFRIILGPKNLRLVKHTCCWCAFLMVALITLAVAWLFIHVFVVPLK